MLSGDNPSRQFTARPRAQWRLEAFRRQPFQAVYRPAWGPVAPRSVQETTLPNNLQPCLGPSGASKLSGGNPSKQFTALPRAQWRLDAFRRQPLQAVHRPAWGPVAPRGFQETTLPTSLPPGLGPEPAELAQQSQQSQPDQQSQQRSQQSKWGLRSQQGRWCQ